MGKPLIRIPTDARKGDVIEIRTLVSHPMESGQRRDNMGQQIPRDIINKFTCRMNGGEIFSAELFPAIAANPFISFFMTATESGELVFEWTDDHGTTQTETARLTVA